MNQLQWHEPRSYRRSKFRTRERASPWEAAKFAAVVFFVVLGLRGLAALGENNANLPGWLPTAALSLLVALFLAYVFPQLLSYVSLSIVILSEKGVNNNIVGHGAQIYFWPWDQIAYCRLSTETIGGKSYETLSMHNASDELLATFALDQKRPVDEIAHWLRHNNIELQQTN